MKYIITILFLMLSMVGFGQLYPDPGTPNGSPTTKVTTRGGLFVDSTFRGPIYVDTTAANRTKVRLYAGTAIFTTSDNNYWLRDATATRWILISNGGGTVCDGVVKAGTITQLDSVRFRLQNWWYRINCVDYLPADTVITIADGGAQPRLDWLGGNASNLYFWEQGTESDNPVPPDLTPNQQLGFALIFVSDDTTIVIPVPPNLDGRYVKIFIDDSIYAKKTFLNDTTWFKRRLFDDAQTTAPTPVIGWGGFALDTNAVNQIPIAFTAGVEASDGTSAPSYSWRLKSFYNNNFGANGKSIINANGLTGSISFPSTGISLFTGNNLSSTNTLTVASSVGPSGLHVDITNPGNPFTATGVEVRIRSGGSTATEKATSLLVEGDRNDSVLVAKTNGNIGLGNNSYRRDAALAITNPGRGILFPRMNTTTRDGMAFNITGTTITLAGTGLLSAPGISVTSITGSRAPVFSCTISGGGVATITILDPGTGRVTGGNLIFDTTGHTIGGPFVLPTGTYSVTNVGFSTWLTIVNTDSTSCPIETWNGSSWIGACGSTSGGVGTFQTVTDAGNSTDNSFKLIESGTGNDLILFQDGDGGNIQMFNSDQSEQLELLPNSIRFQPSAGVSATLKGTNITGAKNLELPNPPSITARSLAISVNGNFADAAGNVTLSTSSGITIGTTTITSGTTTRVLFNNAGVVGEYAISGTGNVAMTTSPSFTTPILGTPTSGTLTNTTGFPVANLAGAGTGVLTFLATPSSANLATALTDETGTGVVVFGTSPAITTSITTPSTTFALLNTAATTVNAFGAATTLNFGASATQILNFGGSTTASEFRFLEPSGSGTNYSAFKAVAQGANITYSLPPTVGAAGSVLTDVAGNGVLTWAAGGGAGNTLTFFADQFTITLDTVRLTGVSTGVWFNNSDDIATSDSSLLSYDNTIGEVKISGPASGALKVLVGAIPYFQAAGGDVYAGQQDGAYMHMNESFAKYRDADDAIGSYFEVNKISNDFFVALAQQGIFGRRFAFAHGNGVSEMGDLDGVNEGGKIGIEVRNSIAYIKSASDGTGELDLFVDDASTKPTGSSLTLTDPSTGKVQWGPVLDNGTYTPTLTGVSNVSSTTPVLCHYTRTGNEVSVWGSLGVTTTLATGTVLSISLPISSTIAARADLSGTGQSSSAIATNVVVRSDTAGAAEMDFIGLAVSGSGTIYFNFSYSIN